MPCACVAPMFTVGLLPGFRDTCTSVHFFLGQPPSVTVLVTSLHRCLLTRHGLSYQSRLIGIPGRLCQTVGSSYYIHQISMSLPPLLAWKKWWLYGNCCFQALLAMKTNTSLICTASGGTQNLTWFSISLVYNQSFHASLYHLGLSPCPACWLDVYAFKVNMYMFSPQYSHADIWAFQRQVDAK